MADSSIPANQHPGAVGVLVVYGIPPTMDIKVSGNRKVGTFDLTRRNQGSFEAALRNALRGFLGHHVNTATARMAFVRNADEFSAVVKNSNPVHLIYYGHALTGVNILLPSLGHSITAWQLSNALKNTGVKDFDILGCNSSSIAAELVTTNPGLRVGYLRTARKDNVEVEWSTMSVRSMRIESQPVLHFDSKRQ